MKYYVSRPVSVSICPSVLVREHVCQCVYLFLSVWLPSICLQCLFTCMFVWRTLSLSLSVSLFLSVISCVCAPLVLRRSIGSRSVVRATPVFPLRQQVAPSTSSCTMFSQAVSMHARNIQPSSRHALNVVLKFKLFFVTRCGSGFYLDHSGTMFCSTFDFFHFRKISMALC